MKDFEPMLIISPNHNWINQHILQNYQMVMNHFSTMTELYTVRENVCTLHPNAYFNPVAQPKQEPIGAAWIFHKQVNVILGKIKISLLTMKIRDKIL